MTIYQLWHKGRLADVASLIGTFPTIISARAFASSLCQDGAITNHDVVTMIKLESSGSVMFRQTMSFTGKYLKNRDGRPFIVFD